MANVFLALPAAAANGAGAWVDVHTMGAEKNVVISGDMVGTVTIEISNEAVATKGCAIGSVRGKGKVNATVAAYWMRAVVSGYQSGSAPAIEAGANDDGAVRANLAVTAGNGSGAPTDVSAMPLTKTITCIGPYKGTVLIEYSEDAGTTWAALTIFTIPGQQFTVRLACTDMRVTRGAVPTVSPGLPVVNVAACEDTSTDPAFSDVVITDSLDLEGRLLLSGDLTPPQILANTNDYAPANFATAYTLRLDADAARNITGIAGGAGGRRIRLVNIGAFDITLKNQDAGSVAANRFLFEGAVDTILGASGGSIELQYDATTGRWRRCHDAATYAGINGTAANPTFRVASEASGMYLNAAGTLAWSILGTGLMTLGSGSLALYGGTSFVNAGAMYFGGVLTPAQINANQNDYAPAGIGSAVTARISSDAARNITGIAGGSLARRLRLENIGAFTITLQNLNGGSAAGNQFSFAGAFDYQLPANGSIELEYDPTLTKWRKVDEGSTVVGPVGLVGAPGIGFISERSGFYLRAAGVLAITIAGATYAEFAAGAFRTSNGGAIANVGAFFQQGVLSPAVLNANTNDYAPAGYETVRTLRISASAGIDLTGIVPISAGQEYLLVNIGANAITLKDENAGSAAGNRFALIADIVMLQDACVAIWYDLTSLRWRVSGKNVT